VLTLVGEKKRRERREKSLVQGWIDKVGYIVAIPEELVGAGAG
jgi:hypothetical protein